MATSEEMIRANLAAETEPYKAQLQNLTLDYQTNINDNAKKKAKQLNELYILNEQAKKNLPQSMALQGLHGGLTESSMVDLENTYQNNRNKLNSDYADINAKLQLRYNQAKNDINARLAAAQARAEAERAALAAKGFGGGGGRGSGGGRFGSGLNSGKRGSGVGDALASSNNSDRAKKAQIAKMYEAQRKQRHDAYEKYGPDYEKRQPAERYISPQKIDRSEYGVWRRSPDQVDLGEYNQHYQNEIDERLFERSRENARALKRQELMREIDKARSLAPTETDYQNTLYNMFFNDEITAEELPRVEAYAARNSGAIGNGIPLTPAQIQAIRELEEERRLREQQNAYRGYVQNAPESGYRPWTSYGKYTR